MSDFQELQRDILHVMDSVNEWGRVTERYSAAVNDAVAKLWQDNAELRDELHALANRVESLTRAGIAAPSSTATANLIEQRRRAARDG